VTDLVATLRAIVRHELAALRLPELGLVTEVFSREAEGSDNNHQVNVRLQGSGLELQRAAVAAGRLGLSALPRVGDLVVVSFLEGDLNAPVVLGSVYDEERRPPVGKPTEVVYQPPDDAEDGVRRFHLELPGGATLTCEDETLHLKLGETEVEVKKDGDVTVKAKGNVKIESQGDLELAAQGDLKLSAQGNVSVQGISSTFEGTSQAKMKAPSLSLAGQTQFSVS
jgi:phage baseplate assembly protein gpV